MYSYRGFGAALYIINELNGDIASIMRVETNGKTCYKIQINTVGVGLQEISEKCECYSGEFVKAEPIFHGNCSRAVKLAVTLNVGNNTGPIVYFTGTEEYIGIISSFFKGEYVIKPILSEKEYKDVLAILEHFFDNQPETGTAEGNYFEALLARVGEYEDKNYPIDEPKGETK